MPDKKRPKPGTAGTGARTTMTSGVGYEANTDMRSESRGSRAFREWEAKYNATGKALQPKSTASSKSYVNTGRKDYIKELNRWRKPKSSDYVTNYPEKMSTSRLSRYEPASNKMNPLDVNAGGMNIDADLSNKEKQQLKQKQNQKYQTKGKKTLLTSQPTKSKGGGKSGGGGGGKWGFFNRMRHSPWNLLRNDKSF